MCGRGREEHARALARNVIYTHFLILAGESRRLRSAAEERYGEREGRKSGSEGSETETPLSSFTPVLHLPYTGDTTPDPSSQSARCQIKPLILPMVSSKMTSARQLKISPGRNSTMCAKYDWKRSLTRRPAEANPSKPRISPIPSKHFFYGIK